MKRLCIISALVSALMGSTALTTVAETSWITLGTRGGPVIVPERAQPANLLIVDDSHSLVDVGDGTSRQLNLVGVPIPKIDNVFISHMHGDHFGGLLAQMAIRLQLSAPKPLQVYGPPGTKHMVDNLLVAMEPAIEAGFGIGAPPVAPETIAVGHDMRSGDIIEVDGFTVKAAKNTHYSFEPGSELDSKYESLSFRFDTPDRSIVYTGDTGASDPVTELATGADLLVAEVIDLDAVLSMVKTVIPNISEDALAGMTRHLSAHHVNGAQLGDMAREAGISELVVTHIASGFSQDMGPISDGIKSTYDGKFTIADDLDRF